MKLILGIIIMSFLMTACIIKNEGTTHLNFNLTLGATTPPELSAYSLMDNNMDTMHLVTDSVYIGQYAWSKGSPLEGEYFYYQMDLLKFSNKGSFAIIIDSKGVEHVPTNTTAAFLADYSKRNYEKGNVVNRSVNCYKFVKQQTGIDFSTHKSSDFYDVRIDTAGGIDYSYFNKGDVVVLGNIKGDYDKVMHVTTVVDIQGGVVYCINKQGGLPVGLIDLGYFQEQFRYGFMKVWRPEK